MVQSGHFLDFFDLQGQRSNVYKQFETGFDLYMNGEANQTEYALLIQAVQRNFSTISSKIIELSGTIQEPFQSFVEKIQALEKQKLQSTVLLQGFYNETKFGARDMTADIEIEKCNWKLIVDQINDVLEEMHAIAADFGF
jgi:hypothetical protein